MILEKSEDSGLFWRDPRGEEKFGVTAILCAMTAIAVCLPVIISNLGYSNSPAQLLTVPLFGLSMSLPSVVSSLALISPSSMHCYCQNRVYCTSNSGIQ